MLGSLEALEQKLRQALLDNLPTLAKMGGFLSESFAPELQHLRIKKDEALRKLKTIEYNARQITSIDSLKVKYNAIIGYFFEVTAKNAAKMHDHSQKIAERQNIFTHRQSTASAARFSSSALEECAHEIAQTQEQLSACETRLYEELVEEVVAQRNRLRNAFEAIAYIDLSAALARIAEERNYTRPKFLDEPLLEIHKARHPVLEVMQHSQSQSYDTTFVANDCTCDEQNFFKLITGPNMAGKSTYLRQNALIILMAQSGCFVPAESCSLGVVDRLCSRMGAADDIAGGKSTFMLEMSETAAIIRQATKHSFLILDEIGRGTATYDGLAIAWAIVEYLVAETKCRTLFATHYHELTELDKTLKPLEIMYMKILEEQGGIVFQYKIAKGATGRSYGIHVAERAGLPRTILARARQVLAQLEKQSFEKKLCRKTMAEQITNAKDSQQDPRQQQVIDALEQIEPDSLSPKEALEKLYTLRAIARR